MKGESMTRKNLVRLAIRIARIAHWGQLDKAGKPYIKHPEAVAKMLEPHGENAVVAGWLHDVVEDGGITLDDLRRFGFPEEVVRAVDSVTRRPNETYMDMIRRASADPLGRLVKLADNAHNSSRERLALLDEDTRERLEKRYAKARTALLLAPIVRWSEEDLKDEEASRG